jgi:hypothetical protein
VAALTAVVAVVVPSDALTSALGHSRPLALTALAVSATGAANVVNSLPALLLALDGPHRMSWGMWAWLLGVNTGAVVLPLGALAYLQSFSIMRAQGLRIGPRHYVKITLPIAVPALAAALVTCMQSGVVPRESVSPITAVGMRELDRCGRAGKSAQRRPAAVFTRPLLYAPDLDTRSVKT